MSSALAEERGRAGPVERLAWLFTAPLVVVAALRLVAPDAWLLLIWLNAFTLYIYLPAYAALLVGLLRRRRALVACSAALILCHLMWVIPDFAPATSHEAVAADAPRLKVFSANLLTVNDTPAGIVTELLSSNADVLLLQEFSDRWETELERGGVFERYPHRVGVVRDDSFGTALLSRLPLRDADVWDVDGIPMARATVEVAGRPLHIVSVHTLPPIIPDYARTWNRQMQALMDLAETTSEPLLLIGDFNATQHTSWLRRLCAGPLRSAHVDRGRATATTFPNGHGLVPPVRLDHALFSDEIVCLGIEEGEGRGSDHRPLLVELALRGE